MIFKIKFNYKIKKLQNKILEEQQKIKKRNIKCKNKGTKTIDFEKIENEIWNNVEDKEKMHFDKYENNLNLRRYIDTY
jgi:hypothetical protein